MSRRGRVALVPVAVALAFAGALPRSVAQPAFPTAVKGSVQQAYVARQYVSTEDGGKEHQNLAAPYTGQPLVLQAAYVGREAAEPTVGIDADGVAFVPASAFDVPGGAIPRTIVHRSRDGGVTWEPVNDTFGPVSVPPVTLDPYITVDETTGRVFNPELNLVTGAFLQYSDDQGETWTQSPLCCGNPVDDHQTMVFGPPPEGGPQPTGYPNIGYFCFNRVGDASCARSLDGGLTWTPTGTPVFTGATCQGDPTHSSFHGHVVVDHAGRVYLPAGYCGLPHVFVSEDAGMTWTDHVVSEDPGVVESEGIFGNHTSVDVDSNGTVYYLWWTHEDRLPVLSVSKDGGATWSKPLNVAPPGVREVNFPTLDVGDKPGQVAISFPGTTGNYNPQEPDPALPWNYYVTTSLNADSAAPLFVSATANPPSDPIHRGRCQGRCGNMFDFIDVEYAPAGEIWAAAVDTCTPQENECPTADDAARNVSTDGEGMAIRQLAGPGLAAPVVPPGPPSPSPPVAAPPRRPDSGLPATGAAWWLLPALLVSAAGAAGLRSRRGRA